MSMNQDETREWTVLVRITEHPGLGDHPWWTASGLASLVEKKLMDGSTTLAIGVEEVEAQQGEWQLAPPLFD